MTLPRRFELPALLAFCVTLAGCDNLTGAADAAKLTADSKATGGACRHAGRGIEDCYSINPAASRAALFAGWKEMNDYMRENSIEADKPLLPPTPMPAPVAEEQ